MSKPITVATQFVLCVTAVSLHIHPITWCQLAEQRNGLRNQQAHDRQNAAQNPFNAQPVVQHAFNPNAPVFVSSKVRKSTNAQTSKTESSSKPLNSASMASQAKGFLPDRHSTSSEPTSPKIPAKLLMPRSPGASSVQETQEASVGPISTQQSAKDAAPPATISELSHSTPLPKHGTQEVGHSEGSASDAKVITDGNQAGCSEVHDALSPSPSGSGTHDSKEAVSAADGQSSAAQNARGSWLTVGKEEIAESHLYALVRGDCHVFVQMMLSEQLKTQSASGKKQNRKSSNYWGQTLKPAGVCRLSTCGALCSPAT